MQTALEEYSIILSLQSKGWEEPGPEAFYRAARKGRSDSRRER